jgi:hypothetical protein
MPTLSELQALLRYAPEEGAFYWLVNHKHPKARVGLRAGRVNALGRAQIGIAGKQLFVHRLVWLFETGSWPVSMLDHINRDPLDNRFVNLRESTHALNGQNQSAIRCGKLLGTSWHKHKRQYIAAIKVAGVRHHLGYFNTEQAAHEAYLQAKQTYHPAGNLWL